MKNKKIELILDYLDQLYPDARCELNYNKDYELLIATVLSAQCTDARVNQVTEKLWQKYSLKDLADADISEIESLIRPVGSYTKKAFYIKTIAQKIENDCNGSVPNDRSFLESLPGVGRKTCNVVLSNIYDVPTIAVDTHVNRVSKRLGLAYQNDDVFQVEKKLMKKIPKEKWSRFHHQMVLFGRYQCKAINPKCQDCKLKSICHDVHL